MIEYLQSIHFNLFYAIIGFFCSLIGCLMIIKVSSTVFKSPTPRILYTFLTAILFAGTQYFGIICVLPGGAANMGIANFIFLPLAILMICLIAFKLSGNGMQNAIEFLLTAGLLSVLIIAAYYVNTYLMFGTIDTRFQPLLIATLGLFSVLFPLVRLLTLIVRRQGTLLKRFPPEVMLLSAVAIAMVSPVLTMSAFYNEKTSTSLFAADIMLPYVILLTVSVFMMVLTDRYREDDATDQYQKIREKEQHYTSLFAHTPDAVIALDRYGKLYDLNDRGLELFRKLGTSPPFNEVPNFAAWGQQKRIEEHYTKVMTGQTDEIEVEITLKQSDTLHFILTSLPILIEGVFEGAYIIAKDVTESKKNQEKIRHLAYYDELTGLNNRKYMVEHIAELTSSISAPPFHLFFIDFDRFKKINDMFGFDFGNKVIRRAADKLSNALPEHTLLARATADEFIAVLPPGFDPIYAAQQIGDEFSVPFRVGQQTIGLTASIGIARFPEDGANEEVLFKHADLARFDAQSRGGGRFAFFDRTRAIENHERLILERDLQAAIEYGELVLFYQPKIDMRTEELVGMEALVRWNHPVLGMVPPLKFISIAEESGLIVPLERWVLRNACLQVQRWITEGHPAIPVAINLSQIHLMQTDIVESVLATLEDLNFDSRLLELEVTESAMMHNEAQVIEVLGKFKQAGISISLDDFGTGYSSLSYLQLLPINCLKIDRSFIKDITTNTSSRAIVEMIVTMARQLGLHIIAEGIEEEEQVILLRELQCFTAQGFYYSKPVPGHELYAYRKMSS
ncbi:bifunctional diguanylate cyclase/phosphodiesterase [Saccharibacillus sp. JS10]|uniref:putative bifunctional diguanylate cyclase/phosphodiesterase n=1 Tax=Saccharibacillus sp. JS10 TaxID=2950552 RepID=UPI00210A5B29|nr:EAL domain-containing protein [Saccharibacillus sp. JS10]MCQ4087581.1 EAL domain-containing protein [Saccharibacillus sp. JS10]